MVVGEESAYTTDMSWKDHLSDSEREELEKAEAAKKVATDAYNTIWRRLKNRCDARMRRAKSSINRSINSDDD